MNRLDRVSRNCLRGEPLPDDLRRLWDAIDASPWDDFVPFTLVEKLDKGFFEGYGEKDGVTAEVAGAYRKMFDQIAFIGKREDGELVGYWLGPENRAASASPIVELDTEGQFRLCGRNLGEYLLNCVNSDDFTKLRRVLGKLGLVVSAKSHTELFESFDTLKGEFGNPNRISWRYQKGLPAPPPTKLRFGSYQFPAAAKVLGELGIENIAANSTKQQVIKQLGEPTEAGEGGNIVGLGFFDPWIKYHRPDCQLRLEFGANKKLKLVSLLEPDWEPGM